MPSHYTLRMQFGLHADAHQVAGRLTKLIRSAPVDEIMFFYYAEELNNGHDTLDEIRQWIEHSRPYRQAVTDAGTRVSLNPWHTLLHCDRGRKLKPEQNWQTMVDPFGRACEAVVCPLDAGWRAYIDEALAMLAEEDFRVIWIDDDIRYHNHEPLRWGGCFCPLHVAEFNRRANLTGNNAATREQIIANITAAGQPHPWRTIWLDMWEDEHLKMIANWRKIIEQRGSRMGLMSSGPAVHAMEGRRWDDWWKTFGGERPPIHRPHFWHYSDMDRHYLAGCLNLLDQNRTLQPDGTECGPEIECLPYGRWNKSFRQIGAQMSAAHILGATNLNISLFDFLGNDSADEPGREEFLTRIRPLHDWLADKFPMTLKTTGVGLPFSPDATRQIHTNGDGTWESLGVPFCHWVNWLGAAGIATTAGSADAINALAGRDAWSYSDEQIERWLSGGLLLDGPAADILVQRGFGKLLGVNDGQFITQDDALYSYEHCLDAELGLREGVDTSVNIGRIAETMYQPELVDGARAVTDLRDPRNHTVGTGQVIFTNARGGRVAIIPWAAASPLEMNAARKWQFVKTCAWLDPANTFGWVEGGPWLLPQFLSDGNIYRGAVWNVSGDDLESFTMHPPKGFAFRTAIQVTTDGRRLEAKLEDGRVTLTRPMQAWEFVVLM